MRAVVLAFVLCVASPVSQTALAQTSPTRSTLSDDSARTVVQLLEGSGFRYSKLSATGWLIRYDGTHKPDLPVYVVATDQGIMLIAVIASSAEVLNHAEVARQLLRLNDESAGNFALDPDDDYVVQMYMALASVDAASFKSRLTTIVNEADDAFGAVKAYVSSGAGIPNAGVFSTPASSTASLSVLGGRAAVAYDPLKWTSQPTKEVGRFELRHANGDGYGIVIAERLELPAENVRAVVEQNMKDSGGTIESIRESRRTVNGSDVLMLEIDAVTNGIRLTYLGYFVAGPTGFIQVFTFTGRNLMSEYRSDLEDLLNGLTVKN